MARLPRLALARHLHLLVQRGHNAGPIVADDADRQRFLDALREAAGAHGVALHAYALLDTHFRLLATPAEAAGLSRAMQALGRRYVAGYNRRHGRSGTLWESRFRATVLEPSAWGLAAMQYVELEPVRHGLCATAEAWRWSSAAHHLGQRRDPLLTDHAVYWQLGNTPFEREAAYRRCLEQGVAPAAVLRLDEASHKGWALGSAEFVEGLAAMTARPVQARRRGRPAKASKEPLTSPKAVTST
jgi:putative transposase